MGERSAAHELDPGWYPDPDGETMYRYHDGEWWTDRTMDVPGSHRDRFITQRKSMRYHGLSDFGDVRAGGGPSTALVLSALTVLALATIGIVLALGGG